MKPPKPSKLQITRRSRISDMHAKPQSVPVRSERWQEVNYYRSPTVRYQPNVGAG